MVLLENYGALPLQSPARIAVVGPFADHVVHDWYSGTPPYRTSIAAALTAHYPDAEVVVADGADRLVLRSLSTDAYLEVAEDGSAITASAATHSSASEFDVTDWG